MIDFTSIINSNPTEKSIDPIDIYSNLDRTSVAGPLRPVQNEILTKWFKEDRNKNDLIVKLHTGAGKTLIGLLMALSYVNSGDGPVVYICPNIYLMMQACTDAKKFGVPFCIIPNDNSLPNDFLEGKKILITYVQKVFNGYSIFGIGNGSMPVGCIILDDSHACIDSMLGSCTINIMNGTPAYNMILSRSNRIIKELRQYENYDEFILQLEDILSNLSMGTEAEKAEDAFNKIGKLLGFISQRPDKEIRKGPDVLWCMSDNKYILIECKTEVLATRKSITKTEAGQMEEHNAWFEYEYNTSPTASILVIPTNLLSNDAYLSHNVDILSQDGLEKLKNKIRDFFMEFKGCQFSTIDAGDVNNRLVTHDLHDESFICNFTTQPKKGTLSK